MEGVEIFHWGSRAVDLAVLGSSYIYRQSTDNARILAAAASDGAIFHPRQTLFGGCGFWRVFSPLYLLPHIAIFLFLFHLKFRYSNSHGQRVERGG